LVLSSAITASPSAWVVISLQEELRDHSVETQSEAALGLWAALRLG
jgi:hypothetical protein